MHPSELATPLMQYSPPHAYALKWKSIRQFILFSLKVVFFLFCFIFSVEISSSVASQRRLCSQPNLCAAAAPPPPYLCIDLLCVWDTISVFSDPVNRPVRLLFMVTELVIYTYISLRARMPVVARKIKPLSSYISPLFHFYVYPS